MVRLHAADASWVHELPPVPTASSVTVTVSDPQLASVATDDLVAGGYRIVGIVPQGAGRPAAVDLLVPEQLRRAQPHWWSRVVDRADRVFDLDHGPVRLVLGEALQHHLADGHHLVELARS